MSTKRFGVATQRYGAGIQVDTVFDTLAEAQQFAATFLPGGAVVCTFGDGRWRAVQ
jgi:hypothetical protein